MPPSARKRKKRLRENSKKLARARTKQAHTVADRLLGIKKKSPSAQWEWYGDIDQMGRK